MNEAEHAAKAVEFSRQMDARDKEQQSILARSGAIGSGGETTPSPRMITQECCTRYEDRSTALKIAVGTFGDVEGFGANEIVAAAKVFETYLKGE